MLLECMCLGCRRDILLIRGLTCRRYIPAAGRFLIVCTFMEDAIRIVTQWNDQLLYLKDYRHSKILTNWIGLRNPLQRSYS